MKIGILCSVGSGGRDRMSSVCEMISAKWAEHTLICAKGYGDGFFPGAALIDTPDSGGYANRLGSAATSLVEAGTRMLTVLGGDGTAAYAADALIQNGCNDTPIFGIAMGTANVGPIVTHNAFEKGIPPVERLRTEKAGAVEALDGEKHVAYAFNDAVIGNTLLATADGKTITVDASLLAREGCIVPMTPADRITDKLTIIKNGLRSVSALRGVAQIIASPVERDNFYGRAVTGILCSAPHTANKAAILISERPVITMEQEEYGFDRPAAVEQMLFGARDSIELFGVCDNALLIIDGNPYLRLNETIKLRYIPEIITIAFDRGDPDEGK